MPKKVTTDHGEILHYAGAHHLFPVRKRGQPEAIRLSGKSDVQADEERVGWGEFFVPFTGRGLVFLYDEDGGQIATRAQAESAQAAGPAGPAGGASAA